ncbi:translation initiation factor eIF-2B subunit alpha [Marchantia polymorpha subsp. ruderalis]|uniref:Translation initiation factor eIF2B subunit alpha n=2 Tax=Marchantia polymorpha TaxID=3197 RepID=A0AAF6AV13_MARPO|nr:hypothetical protein MARPO_0002s0094 [Marchantia polymorpha]BBN00284.1 hypothetical protein Mp_1g27840 [Marchantia polymorpha subsp. ruderalis]|eukprot:PTQ49599.1 hypothetical protein MARPO_0002s0094 [Marchantia polymorpha]
MRRSPFLLFDPSLDNSSSRADSEEGGMAVNNVQTESSPFYDERMGLNSNLLTGPVTFEWLSQAEDARLNGSSDAFQPFLDKAAQSAEAAMNGDHASSRFSVINEFNIWRQKPELAEAVAAIKALTCVIRRSEATTMMGLEIELKKAAETLKMWDKTSISLSAGCDLFMRYVTRTSALEYEDISAGKSRLIERGEKFGEISLKARQTIANLGQEFVYDGSLILTHGYSRVVLALLKLAASQGKRFQVVCTEGRPDNTGLEMAKELMGAKIPMMLILDAGVANMMGQIDMVLLGAEGVVESGGVINHIGTYQTALVARSMNKPVYVAAESYKFARLFPLDQMDMSPTPRIVDLAVPAQEENIKIQTSERDYTPPQYLTLLFTDLGILTPSAVSDELIQLYL